MTHSKIIRKKAKCPHCNSLHAYEEVFFYVVNDKGFWEVLCQECNRKFGLLVTNPTESSMSPNYLVKGRYEDQEPPSNLRLASDIVEYSLDLNRASHSFNYGATPIYICPHTLANLEITAYQTLKSSLQEIISEYSNASNYYLANRCPDFEFVLIPLRVPCSCGNTHVATFYCEFIKNGNLQISENEYLLADISGTSLDSNLMGLFTKTDIMSFLEKLIIRWNLLSNRIVIASPFVGHQYLSKEDKLEIWNWLLSILDSSKSIFITKTKTFNKYKSLLHEVEGLDHKMLEEYDLENKVISSNTKKNDFHAKFYAGITTDSAEVLSGSANLVNGPSIENTSFAFMQRNEFDEKYWKPLNVSFPKYDMGTRHWIVIQKVTNQWRSNPKFGDNIELTKI